MNRSFLLVVLLLLFPSAHFQAQTVTPKSATNTSKHTDAKPAPGSYDTNPETKSLYDDGIQRLEMGQVSEAVERFQKALQLDPEYVPAYSALGRAFFKLRQWENASETLRHAIALKAKKRESEPQKNHLRSTEPDVAPTVPASKPKGTGSSAEKLNKPLPTVPVNALVAVAMSGSGLKPPPVPVAGARTNIKFDDRLGNPPPELREKPEVREKTDAVQPPPVATAPAVAQSTAQPTPAEVDVKVAMNVTPLRSPDEARSATALRPSLADDVALTTVYRVGPQDVLEIRLSSSQPKEPTVFKVTRLGLLEHPQLNAPLPVTGLTVEEVRARIETDLKNQALIENPKAFVGVVEYASHSLVVDGLVKNPGTKFLKSEAVPLAVIVAEAQPLPEAAGVTVVRNGNQILNTDLNHTADTRLLVHPDDVVTLHPQVNESLYVEGKVKFPGEKTYRFGLTLTQAIIMAGGTTSNSSVAEIVRDSEGGVPARFDLKAIQEGKAADPAVEPRDRIILH